MHFLPDIYVPCDVCKGKRYNRETLEVRYKGKNIHEVLEMTVEDALPFFSAIPAVARKLQTLMDVGLSYITLGQNATTLSGGEAQRVKLARELSKRDTGKTLYILDEPTTGLHFHDIAQLLGRAAPAARPWQHRRRHRAQPGRHQDRRLDHRPGTGRRYRRRHRRHHRHAGGSSTARDLLHRAISQADAGSIWPPGRNTCKRRKNGRPQEGRKGHFLNGVPTCRPSARSALPRFTAISTRPLAFRYQKATPESTSEKVRARGNR